MQSTTNPKEHTMKTTLTNGFLAVAAPLAILCGCVGIK
jgi:hypothetical protein